MQAVKHNRRKTDRGYKPAEPTIRIENWSCVGEQNPYIPPERRDLCLVGEVYGHPRFPDGHRVRTSGIDSVKGHVIKTRSGSTYMLGTPEAEYVTFCQSIGKPIDPKQPIKYVR